MVLAMESEEAVTFVRLLAKATARSCPAILRKPAQLAYANRWMGILAVAAQRAFAATLLELPVDETAADGEAAPLADVFHAARLVEPPAPSRLPATTA